MNYFNIFEYNFYKQYSKFVNFGDQYKYIIVENNCLLQNYFDSRPVSNLNSGDFIKCINEECLYEEVKIYSISNVELSTINQYIPNEMYKIETCDGNNCLVSSNELFTTQQGITNVSNLKIGDLVAITPQKLNVNAVSINKHLILSEEFMNEKLCNLNYRGKEKHKQELKDLKYLPLYSDDPRLIVLARIIGYLLTDGCAYISGGYARLSFAFGCKEDADSFNKDLECLGFTSRLIHKNVLQQTRVVTGEDYTSTVWCMQIGGAFASLIFLLDVFPGKRLDQNNTYVPNFVLYGTEKIMVEFLSGIFGGDGSRISMVKSRNIHTANMAELRLTKSDRCIQNLFLFLSNIEKMLNHLGIRTNGIRESRKYTHNNINRIQLSLDISAAFENLIRFFDILEFRYCIEKEQISFYNIIFLKTKNQIYQQKMEKRYFFINLGNQVKNVLIEKILTHRTNLLKEQITTQELYYKETLKEITDFFNTHDGRMSIFKYIWLDLKYRDIDPNLKDRTFYNFIFGTIVEQKVECTILPKEICYQNWLQQVPFVERQPNSPPSLVPTRIENSLIKWVPIKNIQKIQNKKDLYIIILSHDKHLFIPVNGFLIRTS